MELDQLRSFCFVAEERSFSRAARRMFVTQPAISMQIKSLELEIGQSLFDRSKKEIATTEAGKILYTHAKRIFSEMDNARNEIDKIQQMVRGELIVGCSDTVSSYILPALLADFLKEYPALTITVQNRPSLHILQMILEGSAEIGFVSLPAAGANLDIQPFFTYDDVAVCSPAHAYARHKRISLSALAKHRLLLLEPGTKNRMLIDGAFTKANITPVSVMGFGSVEVQKAFAKKNIGIAVVPEFALRQEIEQGVLKVLSIGGIARRKIGVVVRKNRLLSMAAQKFLSLIHAKKKD